MATDIDKASLVVVTFNHSRLEEQVENGTILSNEIAASVIGKVTDRARIGLQPGSVVKTMLVDLDRDTSVAEETIVTTG